VLKLYYLSVILTVIPEYILRKYFLLNSNFENISLSLSLSLSHTFSLTLTNSQTHSHTYSSECIVYYVAGCTSKITWIVWYYYRSMVAPYRDRIPRVCTAIQSIIAFYYTYIILKLRTRTRFLFYPKQNISHSLERVTK